MYLRYVSPFLWLPLEPVVGGPELRPPGPGQDQAGGRTDRKVHGPAYLGPGAPVVPGKGRAGSAQFRDIDIREGPGYPPCQDGKG